MEDEELPPIPTATIEKSGSYDPDTNEMTWIVTVDPDGKEITVFVVDTPGANQTYIANSTSPTEYEPTLNEGKYKF